MMVVERYVTLNKNCYDEQSLRNTGLCASLQFLFSRMSFFLLTNLLDFFFFKLFLALGGP